MKIRSKNSIYGHKNEIPGIKYSWKTLKTCSKFWIQQFLRAVEKETKTNNKQMCFIYLKLKVNLFLLFRSLFLYLISNVFIQWQEKSHFFLSSQSLKVMQKKIVIICLSTKYFMNELVVTLLILLTWNIGWYLSTSSN